MASATGYALNISGPYSSALLASSIARYSVTGINAMATGTGTLQAPETGIGRAVITALIVEATAISDSPAFTISFGTNAASYDNVLTATAITPSGANRAIIFSFDFGAAPTGTSTMVSGTSLLYNISVAAGGTGAQTINLHAFVFYVG